MAFSAAGATSFSLNGNPDSTSQRPSYRAGVPQHYKASVCAAGGRSSEGTGNSESEERPYRVPGIAVRGISRECRFVPQKSSHLSINPSQWYELSYNFPDHLGESWYEQETDGTFMLSHLQRFY